MTFVLEQLLAQRPSEKLTKVRIYESHRANVALTHISFINNISFLFLSGKISSLQNSLGIFGLQNTCSVRCECNWLLLKSYAMTTIKYFYLLLS